VITPQKYPTRNLTQDSGGILETYTGRTSGDFLNWFDGQFCCCALDRSAVVATACTSHWHEASVGAETQRWGLVWWVGG